MQCTDSKNANASINIYIYLIIYFILCLLWIGVFRRNKDEYYRVMITRHVSCISLSSAGNLQILLVFADCHNLCPSNLQRHVATMTELTLQDVNAIIIIFGFNYYCI